MAQMNAEVETTDDMDETRIARIDANLKSIRENSRNLRQAFMHFKSV
jgi:hypothetical protein